MKVTVGVQIEKYRKKRGWSQSRLASSLHISTQAVSKWERGVSLPDTGLLPAIASCLHVSVNELFDFDTSQVFDPRFEDGDEKETKTSGKTRLDARSIDLSHHWEVMQDVHDSGEELRLYTDEVCLTSFGHQLSEWESIEELKHLQLLFSQEPYWGRGLRYFNTAPWWYRKTFYVPPIEAGKSFRIRFSNLDYYSKVWLNGRYLGEHEGYATPFCVNADNALIPGRENVLYVKVWSPWDEEVFQNQREAWTFLVKRNMVKGTYEHADTLIQRDVNPVGIYDSVKVLIDGEDYMEDSIDFSYQMTDETHAEVTVEAEAVLHSNKTLTLRVRLVDKQTGEIPLEQKIGIAKSDRCKIAGKTNKIRLWNTWDQGGPWLYELQCSLWQEEMCIDTKCKTVGFRKLCLVRNETQTTFYLNDRPFYVRGTSYFPDYYISAMSHERYLRDLTAIKEAGFNTVRVHVHTEKEMFYLLCSELGLAVIQDSDYNWMHTNDESFFDRFCAVNLQIAEMLKDYPAMLCLIAMNEPGLGDAAGKYNCQAMTDRPGPESYHSLSGYGIPVIKGSYCEDDPESGDSHTYAGSLNPGLYTDIYQATEKLNTEFGFDAPPSLEQLQKCGRAYDRIRAITSEDIEVIQEYQTRLIQYYIEHYRMQKFSPNAGYVQFLFSDTSPVSFYGVYDWWGCPKKSVQVLRRCNLPVAVMIKYKDQLDGVYAVNDTQEDLDNCVVTWILTGQDNCPIFRGSKRVAIPKNSVLEVEHLALSLKEKERVNVALTIERNDTIIAFNKYTDIFYFPPQPQGHPHRMSQEFGMRLYHF